MHSKYLPSQTPVLGNMVPGNRRWEYEHPGTLCPRPGRGHLRPLLYSCTSLGSATHEVGWQSLRKKRSLSGIGCDNVCGQPQNSHAQRTGQLFPKRICLLKKSEKGLPALDWCLIPASNTGCHQTLLARPSQIPEYVLNTALWWGATSQQKEKCP